jgi:hypothetical protein
LPHGRSPQASLFAHAARRARAQDWAREQVTRICKLAGVPRVTPQGLRGTLATMGREVGNTSQQVADMLGHASPAITERSYIDGAAPRQPGGALDGGCSTAIRDDLRKLFESQKFPDTVTPLGKTPMISSANGRTRTDTVLPTGT